MDTYAEKLYWNDEIRCRWVYDESHETTGSYAYDTEDETREAEQTEIDNLNSGKWVVLGCIVSVKASCDCPECDGWHEVDSCWGIVIEPDDEKLHEYAEWSGWTKRDVA